MDGDPTLEFLAQLRDESRWRIRRGVPIFEPHERWGVGPDGKPKKVTVTAEDLPAIVDECNRLVREKGVVGKLTDVHTVQPDENGRMVPVRNPKPKVLGYQWQYRLGTYGPSQTPCILADWYCYPEHAAEVDRSPHRSVEYYHNSKRISGCAVMVNDPFLDMGMVAYDGTGELQFYTIGISSQDTTPMSPNVAPWYHEPAMTYMREHPGMSYDAACEHVKSQKKPPSVSASPSLREAAVAYMRRHGLSDFNLASILARQTMPVTKWSGQKDHDAAMTYMREHPGTSYDDALAIAKGGIGNPHATPPHHEAAMTYMRQHPGMSYDAACKHVLGK